MTKQSTILWTVAAAAAVTALSIGFLGSPWSKTLSTDFSEDCETKAKNEEPHSFKEESHKISEVRDSPEEKTGATAQREPSVEEEAAPPSTPSKTTTAKGQKWRNRLSAKKHLKLKLHNKHYVSEHQSDSLQAE